MSSKKKIATRRFPAFRDYSVKRFIEDLTKLDDETVWHIAIHSSLMNPVGLAARKICVARGISRSCEYTKNRKQLKEEWDA